MMLYLTYQKAEKLQLPKRFYFSIDSFLLFYALNFSRIEIVTQWKFNNFMELYIHEIIETIYNLYAVSYSESWASWYVTCEECNHRCSEIIYRDYAIRIHMHLFNPCAAKWCHQLKRPLRCKKGIFSLSFLARYFSWPFNAGY